MTYFITHFNDFVSCRGETVESLKKKYGISPSPEGVNIIIDRKYYTYAKEDVKKVLNIWREAGKVYKDDSTSEAHVYTFPRRAKKSFRGSNG